MVKASIIIRTLNEELFLERCLQKISTQKVAYQFETILVDSGSTDNTLNIAKAYDCKIFYIDPSDFSYGRALNLGAKHAEGEILVFLSAHAIPKDNTWLNELTKPLLTEKKTNIVGVYGKHEPHKNANPIEKRMVAQSWKENPRFNNANAAILRTTWEKYHFNEKKSSGEDTLWEKSIESASYKIIYNAKAVVYHSHNESIPKALQRYSKDTFADISLNGLHKISTYINDAMHNFSDDVRYILKNKHNKLWIISSLVFNCGKLAKLCKITLKLCFKKKHK